MQTQKGFRKKGLTKRAFKALGPLNMNGEDLEKKDWKMEASRQTNKKAIVEDNIPPLLELDLATMTRKRISKRRPCHRRVSGVTYQLQLLSLDDSQMVLENGDRLRGVRLVKCQHK